MGKDNMKREVVFIIDGSGSMGTKATDVRGGFNTYIEELKKDKDADEYTISATVFNTSVYPLFTQRSLNEVPLLTELNYMPGGGTALYDAIADTVDGVKDVKINFCGSCGKKRGQEAKFCATCGSELKNGDTSAFTVIIMTDGEENSSQRFRKHHIVNKIQGKEKLGNWTFVYMGANQDAMHEGTAIGIRAGNTISYDTNNTQYVYRAAAASTTSNYHAFAGSGTTATNDWVATASASGVDWDAAKTPTVTVRNTVPVNPKPFAKIAQIEKKQKKIVVKK